MILIGNYSENEILNLINRKGSGAIVSYFGYVRKYVNGKEISKLVCKKKEDSEDILKDIEKEIRENFPVQDVLLYHSIGSLNPRELVAAVIISSEHRQEGFQACKFGIDKIKEREPVERKDIPIESF